LIVLDASAAVDYLIDAGALGQWVRETIHDEPEVAAPHLIELEILSSLRKRVERKDVTRRQAVDAISDFGDLALVRYPVTNLLERIWALRSTLTPYDGAYIALSEALGVALVTTDARLARSHGHAAEVRGPEG
jgi:predicted nucleic acid-binding protein